MGATFDLNRGLQQSTRSKVTETTGNGTYRASTVWITRAGGHMPANGVLEQIESVLQIEFVFDSSAIGLHCAHIDMERGGNLTGAPTSADQLENLQFTVCEAVQ